jgi:hypothetical protein
MSNEFDFIDILKNADKIVANTTDTTASQLFGDIEVTDAPHTILTSLLQKAAWEDDSPQVIQQAFDQLVGDGTAWYEEISKMSKSGKLSLVEEALNGARKAETKLLLSQDQPIDQTFTRSEGKEAQQFQGLLDSAQKAFTEDADTKSPRELCEEFVAACRESIKPEMKQERETIMIESLMRKPLSAEAQERIELLSEREAERARVETRLRRKRTEERAIGDAAQVAFIELTQVSICHALKKGTSLHQVTSELLDMRDEFDLPIDLDIFETEYKKAAKNYAEVAYEAGDNRMVARMEALRKAVENCGLSLKKVRAEMDEMQSSHGGNGIEAMSESNELSSLIQKRSFFG